MGFFLFIFSFYLDGLSISVLLKLLFLIVILLITSTTSTYLISKMAFIGGKNE
ncbi:MAG: hypothetical protein P857_983 [Candidatus Xenolissoclinum pacificiensis L6]|uniref:Uncharacterized protein n=1 Tax=Candidatus Xenolissoclinum pacificiensis L6 TaxID=1401685 RepID=W2V134_9RICK|nr:MAG: hypothetical protein P857_983 [Candidatus Xenolissoclinum pacificiensis L6]